MPLDLPNPDGCAANYPSQKYKFMAIRNRAVLYLLGDTPSRRQELAGLTMGAVDWDNGTIHLLGKGRKERIMNISYDTLEVLHDYRDVRARLKPLTDNLWVSAAGRPMDSAWLCRMLKRLGAGPTSKTCTPTGSGIPTP